MSFTILLNVLGLLALVLVFAITFRYRGVKAAFIVTGVSLVLFAFIYLATIYGISSLMN